MIMKTNRVFLSCARTVKRRLASYWAILYCIFISIDIHRISVYSLNLWIGDSSADLADIFGSCSTSFTPTASNDCC